MGRFQLDLLDGRTVENKGKLIITVIPWTKWKYHTKLRSMLLYNQQENLNSRFHVNSLPAFTVTVLLLLLVKVCKHKKLQYFQARPAFCVIFSDILHLHPSLLISLFISSCRVDRCHQVRPCTWPYVGNRCPPNLHPHGSWTLFRTVTLKQWSLSRRGFWDIFSTFHSFKIDFLHRRVIN